MNINQIDLLSSQLSPEVARKLFNLNTQVGINADRLGHIAGVVKAAVKIGERDFDYFWQLMIPANRQFESADVYRRNLNWVFDIYARLNPAARIDLEAGAHLHDLGYALASGADHNEAGTKVVADLWPEVTQILPGLSLDRMIKIIRYHGLLNDVGYQFLPSELKRFSQEELDILALIGVMDNVAKPWANPQSETEYRSMLFSRIVARFQQLLTDPDNFDLNARLQSVFGPITYVWLKDSDHELLKQAVEKSGLPRQPGYKTIMNKTLVYCWPLFKDLVTPKVEFASSFYTPLEPANLASFVALLQRLSDLIEQAWAGRPQPEEIIVETGTNYFPFENRTLYLAAVRRGDFSLTLQDPDKPQSKIILSVG